MSKKPIVRRRFDRADPVPMKSKVAFKKPLSAHERVLRAVRTHETLRRLNSQPGDENFDSPNLEEMTPHQLMTDPISGEEMTAGEYVMLQHERAEARRDVATARAREFERKKRKKMAPAAPKNKESGNLESDDNSADDED